MIDTQPSCSVTSAAGPEGPILYVEGDLVGTTTDVLEGAVIACLRTGPTTVTVDLAHVRFMDSAGIAALMACRSRAAAQRARLLAARPNTLLARLMRPEVRALLAISPDRKQPPPAVPGLGETRVLRCLACGGTTEHVLGPTTRSPDGTVMVQWWSCTACEEGHTVLD